MTKTKSQILNLIASTKTDDFVDAGKDQGAVTYEAIELLMAEDDKYLVLKALQIAFALGVKAAAKKFGNQVVSAEFTIKEAIKSVR